MKVKLLKKHDVLLNDKLLENLMAKNRWLFYIFH